MAMIPHARLSYLPGVYSITHLASGRRYVGSAVNIRHRHGQHSQRLTKGIHPNRHLQNAWDKYGPDAFRFSTLDYVDDDSELLAAEQQWMAAFPLRYNIRPLAKSNLGLKFSPESRQRVSASVRGRTHTPETRAKIAEGNRGKKIAPDVAARIGATIKGRKLSPEWRAKIAAGGKGRVVTPENLAKRRKTRSDPAWQAAYRESLRRVWKEQRNPQALAIRAGVAPIGAMSLKDAAGLLGTTSSFIRHLIRDDMVPATKVGKFWIVNHADIEARRDAITERLNKAPHKRIGRPCSFKGKPRPRRAG